MGSTELLQRESRHIYIYGDCLQNLTQYVCFLLSGQADVRIAPWLTGYWLTGAPSTALYKRQGGIRLVSRICCLAVRPYLQDVFVPSGQVGVGAWRRPFTHSEVSLTPMVMILLFVV